MPAPPTAARAFLDLQIESFWLENEREEIGLVFKNAREWGKPNSSLLMRA